MNDSITARTGQDDAEIIVIGGGPAGLMAAGRAGELGARTILLEKNPALGRKLLLTGGGRCNVTNSAGPKEFIAAFGGNGKFLYRAFKVFSAENLTGFMKSFGVPTRVDPDGKVFPADDKAQSVLDVLECYLNRGKVKVLRDAAVSGLLTGADGAAAGVKLADGRTLRAKKVIVATGGLSYPGTGSTGDGYAFARQAGHTLVPLRPGLTALESDEPFIKDLQGLTLRDVELTILIDGRKAASGRGELLFTHFGVSGPKLLVLSGTASDALLEPGRKVELSVNLKPELTAQELSAEIQSYFSANGARQVATYLKAALPGSLAPVLERLSGLDRTRQCASVTGAERKKIAGLFSDFRLRLTRARPLREATVTRGGVALKEIDPRTMGSRLVPGLYFCGEVLDLDGITGGYNLQEAFSTGYLAGQAAAAKAI